MFQRLKSYTTQDNCADIYNNYQEEAVIFQPEPLSMIPHKLTGDPVPHYNSASAFEPGKLPNNLSHIIGTLHASGTHVFIKALSLLGLSQVYAIHIDSSLNRSQMMSEEFKEMKKIIVVRDPRDWLCTTLRLKDTPHRLPLDKFSIEHGLNIEYKFYLVDPAIYPKLATEEVKKLRAELESLSNEEQLKKVICDPPLQHYGQIRQLYDCILQFLNVPNVLFIRFEDLIDNTYLDREKYTQSEKTLIMMGNFLDLPLNDKIIHHAANSLPGNTWNYESRNHTGYWKIHFTPEITSLFKKHLGDLVTLFGYESDNNWGVK